MRVYKRTPAVDQALQTADRLVHQDRQDRYSAPHDDYGRVVDIFRAITGHELTAEEGALFMVSVKLARLGHNQQKGELHLDSLVDAAGYLWCVGEIMDHAGYGIV
jgi:hypothetical protein